MSYIRVKDHLSKAVVMLLTILILWFCFGALSSPAHVSAATQTGYSTTDDLNMRKSANSFSKILEKFNKGDSFKVVGISGNWYKVTSGSKTGYIYKKYVSIPKSKTSSSSSATTKGEKIAKYALKFVGNPYRYGGTSLTKGADCSGFTQSIFKHFGYKIPRTSKSQRSAGKKVSSLSKAKPGDLICYYGHVAIYLGNNKIVHASNKKTGIKISNNAKYRKIASIRRIVK